MSISVIAAAGPNDVTDFRFRGLRKILLGEESSLDGSHGGLVAVAAKFGLVLVGGQNCLNIIKTEDVEQQDKICTNQEREKKNSSFDKKVVLPLPGPVENVGVSCDGLTVSVVVRLGQFSSCLLYDTRGLLTSPPDKPLSVTELNTTSCTVKMTGLVWNPALPDMFCTSWGDGSLALYTVTSSGQMDCLTLPPATGARALDWSPRGKQLVVIKQNCELVQYKPDFSVAKYPKLQEMKKIPGPSKAGWEGVSVSWLSTHEFLVGSRQTEDGSLSICLVTGSKAGAVTHCDYDDLCYSTGGPGGSYQCYNLSEWGVVAVASTTSIELGVLGLNSPGPGYTQWILEDNARAEMPLHKNEESFPVGLAVDFTAAEPTPVGESSGPASPILYILSDRGLLCPFYCVNTRQGAPPLSCPRESPPDGARPGTATLPSLPPPDQPPQPVAQVPPVAAVKPSLPAVSAAPAASQPFAFSSPATSTPVQSKVNPVKFAFQSENKPPVPAFTTKPEEKQTTSSASSDNTGKSQGVSKALFGSDQPPVSAFPLSKSSSSSSQDSNPVSEVTNSKINAAIDEEFEAFETELAKLRKNLKNMKSFVGSDEDKVTICSGVEQASKFCRDIIETTECQNTEIFSLRSSTLETFSWLEDAVARDKSGVEHKYQQLLRARPLDPRSARMMEKLRSQLFYCEHQVEEVGTVLDTQWEEHVTKLKRNVRGERSNVMEELSSAVVNNHRILDQQEGKVEELQQRLRKLQVNYPLTMGGAAKSPQKSQAEAELDKLVVSMREKSKLSPAGKPAATGAGRTERAVTTPKNKSIASLSQSITSPVAALSPGLDQSIREALDQRPLTVIKPLPRESPSKPSSAKLLSKLAQSAPLTVVTPGQVKPKAVIYEPISPASPEKTEKLPSTLPAFGSTTMSPVSSEKTEKQPSALPAFGSSTTGLSFSPKASVAPAVSKPQAVPSITKPSQGFGFGSPAPAAAKVPPVSAVPACTPALSSSAKPDPPSGFGFSGFQSTGTSKAFATTTAASTTSAGPGFASTATTAFSLIPAATKASESSVPKTTGISTSGISQPQSSPFSVSSSLPTTTVEKTTPVISLSGDSKPTGGIFSAPNKTVSTTEKEAPKSGIFGQISSGTPSFTSTSTTSSVFGGITTSASSSSVFGTNKTVSVSSASVTPTATDSVSSSSGPSPFTALSAPSKSVFGSTTATTAATAQPTISTGGISSSSSGTSIFGNSTDASKTGIFGTSSSAATEKSSVATSSSSIFGSSTATNKTGTTSIFGTSGSASTGQSSIATGGTASSSSGTSIFGTSTSKNPSIFGGSATSSFKPAGSSSVFAAQPATSQAQTSEAPVGLFSQQTTSSSGGSFGQSGSAKSTADSGSSSGGPSPFTALSAPSKSVFGSTTATTAAFGQSGGTTSSSSGTSIFGNPTAASKTGNTSIFGTPITTTGGTSSSSSGMSIFGTSTATSKTGGTSTTGQSGGISSSSSGTSIFGKPIATGNPSIFGGSTTSGFKSAGSSSVFAAPPATSQPQASEAPSGPFSQQTTASSGGSFGQFGQTSQGGGGLFGGSGGGGGGGGGFLGGLGGSAKSDNPNKNPFGAPAGTSSVFGNSSSQGSSIFSGASSTPFGGSAAPSSQSSFPGTGSGGGFSSGGNVASSGFAVQQQNSPTKPAAAFGGAPSFGGQPFGSPPAFGQNPMMSSANSANTGGAFGQFGSGATASAPTFGSMASGSTPSFGSGGFGGSSSPPPAAPQFSSWR